MAKIEIPVFENKEDLQKFLFENKAALLTQKKSITKEADGIGSASILFANKAGADKSAPIDVEGVSEIQVKAIINTTNVIDSHMDLHVSGLWTKSVQENKNIMHIQEHRSWEFKSIISDGSDLEVSLKNYNWKDLGFDFKGKTEALEFNSKVKKSRNPYMFEQYAKGYVKNHSVGMRYVKLVLCMDNSGYGAEFEAWEKYLPYAVNPEAAEEKGYFWAVTEAKVIEGSAVPMGSNWITPTLSVENKDNEPPEGTQNEAAKALQAKKSYLLNT